jgi:RNA polymerase-binding transcription factor DksA
MSDQSDADEEQVEATVSQEDAETETDEDVVLDLESSEASESRIEELERTVEQQSEEIDELQDLLLDLSTRVADGRGMGVCPECHGPVQKVKRWLGPTTIECHRCGEVFHEY